MFTGPPRAISTLQTVQTTNSDRGIAHTIRTTGRKHKKSFSVMRQRPRFKSPKQTTSPEPIFVEPKLASQLVIDDKFSKRNQLKVGPRESRVALPRSMEKSFSGVLSTSKSNTEIPTLSTPVKPPAQGVFMLDKLKSALSSQFKVQQKKQEEKEEVSEKMKSI
mmetsp:Transcript_11782/g.18070  ORF Transcript_11782/g.18070 Transcript_11782/m.18070 type:complete len:163 (-) Transcript_11782:660-1148(-)